MNAKEIALATLDEAKSVPDEPVMPTTDNGNAIVVIFDGKTFSVNDNGEGYDNLSEESALQILTKDIQQNIDLFADEE